MLRPGWRRGTQTAGLGQQPLSPGVGGRTWCPRGLETFVWAGGGASFVVVFPDARFVYISLRRHKTRVRFKLELTLKAALLYHAQAAIRPVMSTSVRKAGSK